MKWRGAPLYVELRDLAAWFARLDDVGGPAVDHEGLRAELARTARRALCRSARALAFPEVRAQALQDLDELVLDARVLTALATDLGLLSPRQQRFVTARLDRVGRMLGGWRRSLRDAALPSRRAARSGVST